MRERYAWAALVVVLFVASRATTGNWIGDFWSHAAAVRAVAERPFETPHPELITAVQGSFVTPYAVIVGWAARITGIDAVTALAIAGVVNLIALLIALRLYVHRLLPRPGPTAFYGLLLLLFLWGTSPWLWSAFFHLAALPFVAPYPSTFALATVLVVLAFHAQWLRGKSAWCVTPLLLGMPIVLLSHPVSVMVLGVALLAQTVGGRSHRGWMARTGLLITAAVAAVVIASFWPFYPFFDNLRAQRLYHVENAEMYVDVWRRAWPVAVFALPSLLWRLHRDHRDPVALTGVGLLSLYVIGGVTDQYAFGRVIAHAAIAAQLCLAVTAAEFEATLVARVPALRPYAAVAIVTALLAVPCIVNRDELRRALTDRSDWTSAYAFLPRFVGQDEVVLSDAVSGYPVPAFAGKVVSHIGILPLVPDDQERRDAVDWFFSADASADDRRETLDRYAVRWLLLSGEHPESAAIEAWADTFGRVVYRDAHWALVDVSSPRSRGLA